MPWPQEDAIHKATSLKTEEEANQKRPFPILPSNAPLTAPKLIHCSD